MKLYIAILDDAPDFMVPTIVAHAVLGAHLQFQDDDNYKQWMIESFRKCTLRVNQKEFNKIAALDKIYLGHENTTLNGQKCCAVVCPRNDIPNVLKFAKLWAPK